MKAYSTFEDYIYISPKELFNQNKMRDLIDQSILWKLNNDRRPDNQYKSVEEVFNHIICKTTDEKWLNRIKQLLRPFKVQFRGI